MEEEVRDAVVREINDIVMMLRMVRAGCEGKTVPSKPYEYETADGRRGRVWIN